MPAFDPRTATERELRKQLDQARRKALEVELLCEVRKNPHLYDDLLRLVCALSIVLDSKAEMTRLSYGYSASSEETSALARDLKLQRGLLKVARTEKQRETISKKISRLKAKIKELSAHPEARKFTRSYAKAAVVLNETLDLMEQKHSLDEDMLCTIIPQLEEVLE